MTLRELEVDVEQLASERIETITINPSRYVYSKIRVLFEDSRGCLLPEAGEFDGLDIPEFVIQETVFGNSLQDMLSEKASTCLTSDVIRGFGLPEDCRVAGVMFSTEAIFASSTRVGKERVVRGYPFLLVSGQTKSGYHKTILKPLAINGDYELSCSSETNVPQKVKDVIASVEKAPPFLGGFFSPKPPKKNTEIVLFNQAS